MNQAVLPRQDTTLTVPRAVVRSGATVLADVGDLRIEPGRPLTVIGESGSGKSVLAHALLGTLPDDLTAEGSMGLGDTVFDLAERDGRRHLWGRRLALLPQEPALALDPTMRVRSQVAEGVAGWRPRRTTALDRADHRLHQLGLRGAGTAYPHTLSGGMAQRVAFAAATIGGADVLVVDEPSKGLDADSLDQLADLLVAHVEGGGLLLTITHDLRLARRLGGRVAVMRRSSIVEEAPAEEVLSTPSAPYTRYLLAAEPSRWDFDWQRDAPPAGSGAEPVVTAEGISKAYGATPLFEDLSLTIWPGERVALTGPSGVGKTTLGDALLRLTAVDRGTVHHGPAAGAGRLQKLYQDPALSFPPRVPLRVALDDVVRRHRVEVGRVRALMERVGLPEQILERRPGQVSGGELQRVAVVRAMLLRPALVLADEATSRLDLATQASTVDLLLGELTASGCALVLVTHDQQLSTAVADRTVRLAR